MNPDKQLYRYFKKLFEAQGHDIRKPKRGDWQRRIIQTMIDQYPACMSVRAMDLESKTVDAKYTRYRLVRDKVSVRDMYPMTSTKILHTDAGLDYRLTHDYGDGCLFYMNDTDVKTLKQKFNKGEICVVISTNDHNFFIGDYL